MGLENMTNYLLQLTEELFFFFCRVMTLQLVKNHDDFKFGENNSTFP